MSSSLRPLLLAPLALALLGCPGPDAPKAGAPTATPPRPVTARPAVVHDGAALYKGSCAACHGDDARGRPGLGLDLVASKFVGDQTDAQLLEFIKRGRDASDPASVTKVPMPPRGGNPSLDDAKLTAIIAHLRGLRPSN